MIPITYWLINAQFVISALGAFAFFAAAWLNIDSWYARRELKTGIRAASFLILAGWSIAHGIDPVTTANDNIRLGLIVAGVTILLVSYLIDPIPLQPKSTASDSATKAARKEGIRNNV